MDNQLQIQIAAEASGVLSGVQAAEASIQELVSRVEAASANLASAQEQLSSAAAAGNEQAISILKQYEAELTEAQGALSSYRTAALETAAVQEELNAAVGHTVPQMAAASGAVRLLEGNTTGSIRAAERFLTTTLQLGPVLQAAFPVVGALAMIGVLEHVYTKIIDVTDALGGLTSATKKWAQDLIDENTRIFASFDNVHSGMQRLGEVNAQIVALEKQKEINDELTKTGDVSTFGIIQSVAAARSNVEIQDKLIGLYKLRQEMLQNLNKIQADNNKETEKENEQAEKDLASQKKEALKERDAAQQESRKLNKELDHLAEIQQRDDFKETSRIEEEELKGRTKAIEQQIKLAHDAVKADIEQRAELGQIAVKAEEQNAKTELSLHQITFQQSIQMRKDAADKQLDIERAKYQALAQLEQLEGKSDQDSLDKIAIAEAQHAQKIKALDDEVALHKQQAFDNAWKQISATADQAINGFIQGTQTWSQAWQHTIDGMVIGFFKALEKMLMDWITHHELKNAVSLTQALKNLTQHAMNAAAGAYEALVQIPIIGPVLAPPGAALAFAAVEGFGAMASAAGGWEVPADTIAQVHKNEMILPADLSTGIRNMVRGGGAAGDTHFHFAPSVQAMDATGVDAVLTKHRRLFVKQMQTAFRNGEIR